MKRRSHFLTVAVAVCATTMATCLPAHADELPSSGDTEQAAGTSFSPAEWEQAYREFESTDLPRDFTETNGSITTTFHLPNDLSLTMVRPDAADSSVTVDVPDARLGFGKTAYGYSFAFNQFDQNALSNILVTAGITAAICAIPAVGQVACALAGVVVGVAVTYVHKKGVCSGNRTLYWYDVRGGSVVECRSSAPR